MSTYTCGVLGEMCPNHSQLCIFMRYEMVKTKTICYVIFRLEKLSRWSKVKVKLNRDKFQGKCATLEWGGATLKPLMGVGYVSEASDKCCEYKGLTKRTNTILKPLDTREQ